MHLRLSPLSICRTPVFSVDEKLENVWDRLKTYIEEASPTFFEIIKNYDYASLELLDQKARFTIWKYFNRAKFRATPYGNFAAFSLVPLSKGSLSDPVILSAKPLNHRFPNWKEQVNINMDPKWLLRHCHFLRSNTSSYICGDELRYVNIQDGFFELSATITEKTILDTLSFCHAKRTVAEVQSFIQATNNLDKSIADYFLQQLIFFQLLITDFHPNIIGNDYFNRIGYAFAQKKDDYIIAERPRISGHLPEEKMRVLLELTDFLSRHISAPASTALNEFKEQFSRKFENRSIPLLRALDPEIGTGYRSLTQDKEENQLIQDLNALKDPHRSAPDSLTYPALHQFILNGLLQQKPVQLEDYQSKEKPSRISVANTFSVLLQYSGDFLVVDQIGGATANALLGRFSMASEELMELGIKYSETEQEANPDVLFFDIAYQLETHTDNINRRRAIYTYELPILSWSESEHIIDPDDILVSISANEVVLHSIKYGKRLVPRLASAYNYNRSDLALYRFLSDLQHQNLQSSLSISASDIFPGLVHYERIAYRNVILSAEKWLVPKQVCSYTDINQARADLQIWLSGIKLERPFKCGSTDQTLTFFPEVKEDMTAFLLFCRNKTGLYIEETFIPPSSIIKDENNRSYISEFIINLQHRKQLYLPSPTINQHDVSPSATCLPGSDWLYFEIYCHSSKSNSILLHLRKKFLASYSSKFKNWFFIRYNDPAYHIRLRVHLRDKANVGECIKALADLAEPLIHTGIISDLQIKTYRKETERYGIQRIHNAEKCFGTDSNLVLTLISRAHTTHSFYSLSIILLENVFSGMELDPGDQLKFTENMANIFSAEMNVSQEGLKKINQGYKDFMNDISALTFSKQLLRKLQLTSDSFLKTLETGTESEKNKVLSDLFHMHVNRLFSSDQRMHEMIIYCYLTRILKMRSGRLKQLDHNNSKQSLMS